MLPLIRAGLKIVTLAGADFRWRGDLCWSLYGKYLHHGEGAAREIFADRRSVGMNTVCVAGMLSWGHPFSTQTPGYWEKLSRFMEIAREEQMRVCWVTFCDTRLLMPDYNQQRAHWQRIYVHNGAEPNLSLGLVNQAGHPTQTIDQSSMMTFEQPPSVAGFPGLLSFINNPFEDNPCPSPAWDFSAFCGKRNEPNWYMEAGCVSMWTVVHDQVQGPAILFETPPAGRGGHWDAAGEWRQLGRSLCFDGTSGGNFYSDQSAQADVFTGIVRNCAVEFAGNIPNA